MVQDYAALGKKMVDEQLVTRGIRSPSVLDAMRSVPRHLFVHEDLQDCAYADSPLPTSSGQTISQPYIVAYMTEQLELASGMKVLEIGTGSGYQSAILAHLGCAVYTVELLEELATKAKNTLATLGYDSVKVKLGNGFDGWPDEAPFDAVIVTAAPDRIPEHLIDQLKDGGRMIVPIGQTHAVQILKLITKKDKMIYTQDLLPVRFVPMI